MRRYLTLIPLAAFASCTLAQNSMPWANIGGFWPGMSKAEAKTAGYENCGYGKAAGERSDSVYCDIPAQKRALGQLKITSARLEFKPPNLERVHKIHVTAQAKLEDAMSALKMQYGEMRSGGNFYAWQRETPQMISLYRKQFGSTAQITFSFEPGLPAAMKKQAEQDAKKSQTLNTF